MIDGLPDAVINTPGIDATPAATIAAIATAPDALRITFATPDAVTDGIDAVPLAVLPAAAVVMLIYDMFTVPDLYCQATRKSYCVSGRALLKSRDHCASVVAFLVSLG